MSTTAFTEGQHQPPFSTFWSPERAVLTHLLDHHPRRLTLQELAGEMSHGFGETAIKRAVDNLAAACFLHREGATLIPAPAVVNFDQGTTPTKF